MRRAPSTAANGLESELHIDRGMIATKPTQTIFPEPFSVKHRSLCLCLAGGLAVTLGGCGDDDVDLVDDEVAYVVDLDPLNDSGVDGTVQLVEDFDGDLFSVSVEATGTAPNALHPQHIHAAGACPDPTNDENADGYVDVVEGLADYGAILIPLDGDLSEQAPGMPEGYPVADGLGLVDYSANTGLSEMIGNLQAANPEPPLTGLDGDLALTNRTVVLHGIAETSSTTLPDTVQSAGGNPAYVTLPVACGTIELLTVAD